ncbi:MAG TPA: NAD(+) synthase [Patescibacteria group bacterium]|nr:NAD(+) synthase [Patescibacteria group bacterium]
MALSAQPFNLTQSFFRVAAACPQVAVGDVQANVRRITQLYQTAANQQVGLVIFPELSVTGYTLGDLVQQRLLLDTAKQSLASLAGLTKITQTAMVIGLPFVVNNALYDCAALLARGRIQGIVPKRNLPNYKEFYDKRWFQTWDQQNIVVNVGGQQVSFGTDLLFSIGQVKVGIEICEDLWVAQAPSEHLAAAGAIIIANPSASPEQVTKSNYRRQLVTMQSGRLVSAYVYAGCDASESTTDVVMSGHQIIAENGQVLAERQPLAAGQELTVADVDIDHIMNDRLKDTNFSNSCKMPVIDCGGSPEPRSTVRNFAVAPFVPSGPDAADNLQRVLDIQAQGLATRLANTHIGTVVLGLSGGLDSTLALLAAVHAAARLGTTPGDLIQTITMPGEASTKRTQSNATRLATALGIPNQVIPITKLAQEQLAALGHDGNIQDVTYENVQARVRTSILFNRANQVNGLVLGTGDLSEIALGWCTYNGDHMSHYNVNASIPKTLVRHLVAYAAKTQSPAARQLLTAILNTPISPELTRKRSGAMSQKTEDIIGPYALHDFFLYHFIRWNDTPDKIEFMAGRAFAGEYQPAEIRRWLAVFMARFMQNQWKRSVAADGPKVGSVSLSPRGDWRMPSDMSATLWTSALQ